MIITQWTAADTAFVDPDYDRDNAIDAALVGDEYAVTLDAEMLAELNAEREDHAKFNAGLNNNLSDGLSSDEEDAEVGRLWGIDASRVEDGE